MIRDDNLGMARTLRMPNVIDLSFLTYLGKHSTPPLSILREIGPFSEVIMATPWNAMPYNYLVQLLDFEFFFGVIDVEKNEADL